MLKGIDVSTWQDEVNWDTVANEIDFAILRAGFGSHTRDNMLDYHYSGCKRNNIPFGLYWFSYALSEEEARTEARQVIEIANALHPTYPIYFDFEYDSRRYAESNGIKVSKDFVTTITSAFCEEIEKAGYYAGIYANEDYINNFYHADIFTKYDLWYALYNGQKDLSVPPRKCNIWQYTSSGNIKGVSGNCDVNVSYVDFPKLIEEKGLTGNGTAFSCPLRCPYCKYGCK